MSEGHSPPLPRNRVRGGPTSRLGDWALRVEGLFLVFLISFYGGALTGRSGGGPGSGFFSNPYLARAISLRHERSLLVFLVLLVGVFVVLVAVGERSGSG